MHIHAIYVYPIKGCRGSTVSTALLRAEGLEHDRRWMIVDASGEMISQRSHPILTQFIPTISGDRLEVRYQDRQLAIGLDESINQATIQVHVFDDTMLAHLVGSAADRWFSDILGEEVRFVKVGPTTQRIKNFRKYVDTPRHDTAKTLVSFADGYPYLVLGTASMDHLNDKLDTPLSIDRFRANIIIKTEVPHIEDTWKEIMIGDQSMTIIKPCARCQVPNIDPITGHSGKEPNRTLANYRRDGNKVNFGMNAASMTEGAIAVGDKITF